MKWVAYVLTILLLLQTAFAINLDDLDQQAFVNDVADILTPQEEQQLTSYLIALEQNTTLEFAVVTYPSIDQDMFLDSFEAAEYLGVGKQDTDNGLLLYIVPEQRQYFIQIGQGLEASVPDALSNQVATKVLVPAF